MHSRVIGRYRQTNGGIVRCDVECERKETPKRVGENGAGTVVGTGQKTNSPASPGGGRKEAAREARPGFSFMLTL